MTVANRRQKNLNASFAKPVLLGTAYFVISEIKNCKK